MDAWPAAPQILNTWRRAEYGCIVTFEKIHSRDRLTIHRDGPPVKGLREACAIAVARDEDYRIICYSTPQTIMSDLHGRKPTGGTNRAGSVDSVEASIVSMVGLRHMLHPRLILMLVGKRRPNPSEAWRP